MGDLIPNNRLLEKQITADAQRELEGLYRITAGFQDPAPLTDEEREMQEAGVLDR